MPVPGRTPEVPICPDRRAMSALRRAGAVCGAVAADAPPARPRRRTRAAPFPRRACGPPCGSSSARRRGRSRGTRCHRPPDEHVGCRAHRPADKHRLAHPARSDGTPTRCWARCVWTAHGGKPATPRWRCSGAKAARGWSPSRHSSADRPRLGRPAMAEDRRCRDWYPRACSSPWSPARIWNCCCLPPVLVSVSGVRA
jgi:hypothetical protein